MSRISLFSFSCYIVFTWQIYNSPRHLQLLGSFQSLFSSPISLSYIFPTTCYTIACFEFARKSSTYLNPHRLCLFNIPPASSKPNLVLFLCVCSTCLSSFSLVSKILLVIDRFILSLGEFSFTPWFSWLTLLGLICSIQWDPLEGSRRGRKQKRKLTKMSWLLRCAPNPSPWIGGTTSPVGLLVRSFNLQCSVLCIYIHTSSLLVGLIILSFVDSMHWDWCQWSCLVFCLWRRLFGFLCLWWNLKTWVNAVFSNWIDWFFF